MGLLTGLAKDMQDSLLMSAQSPKRYKVEPASLNATTWPSDCYNQPGSTSWEVCQCPVGTGYSGPQFPADYGRWWSRSPIDFDQ